MSPKEQHAQSTLNLPKSRRNTRQFPKKSYVDEGVIHIGRQQKKHHQQQATTTATTTKPKIHQEELDETDKLLRDFDLNYAFGPCVGIKRLERWERAQNLGIDPPFIVRDILTNTKTAKHEESVFYQFRMI